MEDESLDKKLPIQKPEIEDAIPNDPIDQQKLRSTEIKSNKSHKINQEKQFKEKKINKNEQKPEENRDNQFDLRGEKLNSNNETYVQQQPQVQDIFFDINQGNEFFQRNKISQKIKPWMLYAWNSQISLK